ncbi:hypothetical protein G3I60_23115 [Streptomyces sp. SID13666]|uniref:peptidase inhibitor family I36 protein n=1 Tax=Streptomyces TaxID=1883 RepID=UPI0011058F41|nr:MULTISPECIES: peptidase inhibitor family I36 protein [Streptomyces]MCZ4097041.1 hypothetical protein [Streptomyces sp. H39-C1]NEA56950.1 hypothetical protein [Streptomyces sp. SID13666]NEA74864.1 hypothetical protein [Streptomyces sp. SID13588]QNA74720.1 hypothetical protein C8250_025030 [Streptomyces sp. So13.3]
MTPVNRTTLRRTLATTLALAALGTASLVCAGPADALGKDGNLEPGELGLYYAQNRTNLLFDLFYAGNNFAGDRYAANFSISPNDNTESYWNRDAQTWSVWTDAYRAGVHGWIPAYTWSNASTNFKNKISSANPG